MTNKKVPVIGFVGLDVMGSAICRTMALKHDGEVLAFDAEPATFVALEGTKARRASTVSEVGAEADIVFLSLPDGSQVEEVCLGSDGLTSGGCRPSVIVDMSTTAVDVAHFVAERLVPLWVRFADAPIVRAREAAQPGELSIMVGADQDLYEYIEPLLRYISSDVTHCGGVGCGLVVKLINNALVFENTVALAEMMVIGERAGVQLSVLLDAVSKSSGDSFALRNHGRKSMLSREFPETFFSSEYALKELDQVIDLAWQLGVGAHVTRLAEHYYAATASNEWSGRYYPAVIEIIDRNIDPALPVGVLDEE